MQNRPNRAGRGQRRQWPPKNPGAHLLHAAWVALLHVTARQFGSLAHGAHLTSAPNPSAQIVQVLSRPDVHRTCSAVQCLSGAHATQRSSGVCACHVALLFLQS